MFKFITLFKRFIPPYKKYVALSFIFNILSTVFSLFSFATFIPILQILFGLSKATASYQYWTWSQPISVIFNAIKNNLEFQVQQTILSAGPSTTLIYLGVFLIVMTFFKTSFAFFGAYFISPIRTGVVRDLRTKLYNKILSLPLAFFSNERKGDLMSRMTGDVGEVEASIMSSLDMIFKNPLTILIYLIVLFSMSWQLTLFVLILLPLSGWLIGNIGRTLRTGSRKAQEQSGDMLSQIDETLGGLRVIKAFNAEHKLEQRFAHLNNQLRRTYNDVQRRFNLAHPVSELLGTTVIAALLWFGGNLIVNHHSSIGAAEFIYYVVIFYSIIAPAKELSKASYSIEKGLISLDRIDKILKTENTILEPENPVKIEKFNDCLEFKNLSFRYQTDWVLKNINLKVKRGETIALVGQSGSGKSTLVDLVPRFYDPIEGEILIDGTNIKAIHTHNLRELMGNVNQEAILFNDTFFNNIAFGVENATLEKVIEAAKIANAHDFIMATEQGYETNIGDRGNKLSGGQRQRLSIARAILKNPPILILDEATSALDTESEKLVQEALEKLMLNRTTLVVAHRLSTIKKADEICVMMNGEIVERGKHDELMALNGNYKRLVDMQSF